MFSNERQAWYREWIDPDALPAHVVTALDAPNFATIVETRRRESPAKRALTLLADDPSESGVTRDYETLVSAIFRTARVLRAHGQSAEKAVLFLGLPSVEGLTAFWAAQVFGAVWPVNPMLSLAQLQRLATSMPVAAVIAPSPALSADIHAKASAIADLLGVRLLVAEDGDPAGASLARLAEQESGDFPEGALPGDTAIAACFPTGGTTGLPRVALLSHRNQIAGIVATALIHDPSRDIVTANGLPLFHVGGGVIATTRALVLGQTLVQLSPAGFRATRLMERFWEEARAQGIDQIIAVPTVFSDMLERWRGGRNPIRYFIAGASKLPASLNERYEQSFGIGVHEGYGMTECSGFATGNAVSARPRAGSAGSPLPFYAVRVGEADSTGAIACWCDTGTRGRVMVRGPAVFSGYTDAAHTRKKFLPDADGRLWLDTGDIGSFDSDGALWITGRDKDIIIRGGHNIDAASIETVLLAHPAVTDAAAVGLPDARVGELPIAFVSLEPDEDVAEADLVAFARAHVEEPAAAPVRVVVVDALPRTAMNKVFKPDLRRRALEIAIAPLLPEGIDPDSVRIALEENGDLHAFLPADPSFDLKPLSDFLARTGVHASRATQGQTHA